MASSGGIGVNLINASPVLTGNLIENHCTGVFVQGGGATLTNNTCTNHGEAIRLAVGWTA